MKIFTISELNRQPSKVLDVADRDGVVRIKRRDGRVYLIRPDARPMRILPDFRARRRAIFPKPIPVSQTRLVDKLIAGE